jgi:hypothetical protein
VEEKEEPLPSVYPSSKPFLNKPSTTNEDRKSDLNNSSTYSTDLSSSSSFMNSASLTLTDCKNLSNELKKNLELLKLNSKK